MTDGQSYYDGLVQQGYPTDQALSYTQQYYPGFYPASNAQSMSISNPQPISQPHPQPISQPHPQHISQQQYLPPANNYQQIAQPMINTMPINMSSMAINEKKPIMAWVAIGCVILALILTGMGLFGNSWLIGNEEDNQDLKFGLSKITIDCSSVDSTTENTCIQFTYTLLADDMDKAAAETPPSDPILEGDIENYCENLYSFTIGIAGDDNSLRSQAGNYREMCLSNDSAGGVGSIVLWLGMIALLTSAIILVMATIGKQLPASMENYGHISSWISGGLVLIGSILWLVMKDNLEEAFSSGSSFTITIIAGILAIIGGTLHYFDKQS